jgi:hypothetical protein
MSSKKKTNRRNDQALARAVAAKIIKDKRKSGSSALVVRRGRRSERKSNQSGQGRLVAAPTAMSRAMRFRPSRPQRTIVKATEEVELFNSQALLGNTSYRMNPGNAVLFPYLSVQAKQWEFYRFKRIKFMYVTRCATDKNGIVILSPDYDNRDANPTDEKELMNTKDAVQDALWKDVECELDTRMMYSQGARKKISDSLMYDRDLYDSGVMRVATIGDAVTAAGALFVEYECELMVPSQPEQTAFGENFQGVFAMKDVVQNLTSGVDAVITFDYVYGDSVALDVDPSNYLWTATAKSKWLVTFDATMAGSTAASAFIASIRVNASGGISEAPQKTQYPADTGAHYVAMSTSAIVELAVGQSINLIANVTASATATIQTATLSIIPY